MNDKFWSDLTAKGAVLVYAPRRKIAIYPNDGGLITIAIHDDEGFAMTTICPGDEATEACRLILNANKEHEELTKEINAMSFVMDHKE